MDLLEIAFTSKLHARGGMWPRFPAVPLTFWWRPLLAPDPADVDFFSSTVDQLLAVVLASDVISIFSRTNSAPILNSAWPRKVIFSENSHRLVDESLQSGWARAYLLTVPQLCHDRPGLLGRAYLSSQVFNRCRIANCFVSWPQSIHETSSQALWQWCYWSS